MAKSNLVHKYCMLRIIYSKLARKFSKTFGNLKICDNNNQPSHCLLNGRGEFSIRSFDSTSNNNFLSKDESIHVQVGSCAPSQVNFVGCSF